MFKADDLSFAEVLPEQLRRPPYPGEEYDAAELPNGDLLLVFRWAVYDSVIGPFVREERRQSVLKKQVRRGHQAPFVRRPFRTAVIRSC